MALGDDWQLIIWEYGFFIDIIDNDRFPYILIWIECMKQQIKYII
jgi:hypothetical protein